MSHDLSPEELKKYRVGKWFNTTRGAYQIRRIIGRGGMGIVLHVGESQNHGHRQYALKAILPRYAANRGGLERFANEGMIVSRIEHNHIIQIYGLAYLQEEGEPATPFIVMELLSGFTLRHIIDQSKAPFSVEDVCMVGMGVSDALHHCHGLGLIHRDLKPDNLFIDKKKGYPRVVVLDFGIVKVYETTTPERTRGRDTEGFFIGSFATASPEQLLGQEVTPRSDVYSLGVTLYEMITRKGIFPDLTDERQIGQAHIDREPVRLHDLHLEVQYPVAMLDVVMRSLAKNAADRPEAFEVRAAYEAIWNSLLVEKVQGGAGHSTIQRWVTKAAGLDWAPSPEDVVVPEIALPDNVGTGTVPLAPALRAEVKVARADATTAPCEAPVGSTSPGTRGPRQLAFAEGSAPQTAAQSENSPPRIADRSAPRNAPSRIASEAPKIVVDRNADARVPEVEARRPSVLRGTSTASSVTPSTTSTTNPTSSSVNVRRRGAPAPTDAGEAAASIPMTRARWPWIAGALLGVGLAAAIFPFVVHTTPLPQLAAPTAPEPPRPASPPPTAPAPTIAVHPQPEVPHPEATAPAPTPPPSASVAEAASSPPDAAPPRAVVAAPPKPAHRPHPAAAPSASEDPYIKLFEPVPLPDAPPSNTKRPKATMPAAGF